jgi:hypothetical protein
LTVTLYVHVVYIFVRVDMEKRQMKHVVCRRVCTRWPWKCGWPYRKQLFNDRYSVYSVFKQYMFFQTQPHRTVFLFYKGYDGVTFRGCLVGVRVLHG